MSISNFFSIFCKNLEMSDSTISNIRNRYKQITKRINLDYRNSTLETDYSLYVGSYGRNTEIWTSDIDIIVILPYEVYVRINKLSGNKQSSFLQEVKKSLQKTYSTSFVRADGQVIGINFSDGINFEIVPTFLNTDRSYTYPDTNDGGSWKSTDPKSEIKAMIDRNKETNGNLKQLCRMARSWKRNCNVNMSGILIDTLAYNFINTWEHKDKSYTYYDWMSRDFFEYLKNLNTSQLYWLAPGSGRCVRKDGNFNLKAKIAHEKSLEAIKSYEDNLHDTAKRKWREIYGTKFPE